MHLRVPKKNITTASLRLSNVNAWQMAMSDPLVGQRRSTSAPLKMNKHC